VRNNQKVKSKAEDDGELKCAYITFGKRYELAIIPRLSLPSEINKHQDAKPGSVTSLSPSVTQNPKFISFITILSSFCLPPSPG